MIKKAINKIKKLRLLADLPKVIVFNLLVVRNIFKADRKAVLLFEITTMNEFFFLQRVIERLHQDGHVIIFTVGRMFRPELGRVMSAHFPRLQPRLVDLFWAHFICRLDFYINATLSYDISVPKRARRKIHFPHCVTSKTRYDAFSKALEKMTDIFATGEFYVKDLHNFCNEHKVDLRPDIHKVGCPKSDALFNHTVDKKRLLATIGLNPDLPVIFYAPTWNQETSIFSWLDGIFEIPDKHNVNLIIKIHPGMYVDPKRKKISGGVDWKAFFEEKNLLQKRIYNVCNMDSTDFVAVSDIAITDISTIWIEFYLLRKPIIFLDVAKFWQNYKKNSLGDFWLQYGYFVKNTEDMHENIQLILNKDNIIKEFPKIDDELLFNKGKATQAAVEKIKMLTINQ